MLQRALKHKKSDTSAYREMVAVGISSFVNNGTLYQFVPR